LARLCQSRWSSKALLSNHHRSAQRSELPVYFTYR